MSYTKEKKATYNKAYYEANRAKAITSSKAYYKANQDRVTAYSRTYYATNSDKEKARSKIYKEAYRDKAVLYGKAYREANPDKIAASSKAWRKANPGKVNAYTAKRRAAKLRRTVTWANLDRIKEIYAECEEINVAAKLAGCTEVFVVDHIIPLQGANVSGLHIESNLQIITQSENSSKANKFTS